MAKARKKRRQAVRDEPKPIPPWIWLGLGVLMGLGLAVYLAIVGLIPTQGNYPQSESKEAETVLEQPEDLSDEPELNAQERPREYEFYKILPDLEVVVPEAELRERAGEPASSSEVPEQYVIQAGSFERREDADSMKAQLTLLGLPARIETVDVNGRTWHRVRAGPYGSAREVDQLRRRLRENRLDVLILNERG